MKHVTKIIDTPYVDRETRNKFIAEQLDDYLGESVLNIGGGGRKHLAKYIKKDTKYHEVDIAGEPDFVLNLEKDLPLPIEDNSFDTVICTDVLEHLDNLHEVFSELHRVCRKHLIVSLPNPSASILNYLTNRVESRTTSEGTYSKFYGLPIEKPEDRHKWYFSFSEAETFLAHHAEVNGMEMEEFFGTKKHLKSWKRKLAKVGCEVFLGPQVANNVFCTSIWSVMGKKQKS